MGPVFRHQHAAGTEWALRRQHLLGRSAQLLFLARPDQARHRRALHPDLALLRRAGRRALRRVRARPLCGARLSPRDRHQPSGEPSCTQSPESPARSAAHLRSLLAERVPVRAVLRDEAKAAEWRTRGCDVALAETDDAESLTSAFRGAAGVFILPPSEFDPEPGFPEAKRVIAAVTAALTEARPGQVVCLSTIGADAPHENLLTQRTLMEQSLKQIGLPVTFLRPGWFMENALWDVPSARDEGVLRSFLQPADKLFPMVATQDVGRLAAALLREDWSGTRVVELEGAARVSPNDLARAFATVLERPVRVETVPRE